MKATTAAFSKLAMGACALVLAGSLGGCALTTPSRAEVEPKPVEAALAASDLVEDGYLTVGMDTADAPQVLTDAEGKPSGYYSDLARAISAQLGLKFKLLPAASAATSVSEGKVDVYLGAKASEAAEDVTVSASILEDGSALFAKTADGSREVPTLSVDALHGTTIAVQDASASQDALTRAGIDAARKTYPNVNKCFDALAAGEVDYVACDASAGSYLARAYPGTVFAGTISALSSYGVAYANNSAVASAVSEVLDELISNGTVDAIHTAWYGATPLSLSDTLLSGVTLSAATSSNEAQAAEGEGAGDTAEGEGADGTAVGEDINSLG